MPLDESYSYDFGSISHDNQLDQLDQSNQTELSTEEKLLLVTIQRNPDITNNLLAEELNWSVSRVKYYIQKLKKAEKIKRNGTNRKGSWEVIP